MNDIKNQVFHHHPIRRVYALSFQQEKKRENREVVERQQENFCHITTLGTENGINFFVSLRGVVRFRFDIRRRL